MAENDNNPELPADSSNRPPTQAGLGCTFALLSLATVVAIYVVAMYSVLERIMPDK